MTSRPIFPFYVVQRLPTPPGDPYSTRRWNQNETQWPHSSTCADVQSARSHSDSKHVRRVRPWVSSQRFECFTSEWVPRFIKFLPYPVFIFYAVSKLSLSPLLLHAPVTHNSVTVPVLLTSFFSAVLLKHTRPQAYTYWSAIEILKLLSLLMLTVYRIGIDFSLAASPSLDSRPSTHSKPLCICVRRI